MLKLQCENQLLGERLKVLVCSKDKASNVTAQAGLSRALHSPTRAAGRRERYQSGDQVDFYRIQSSEDASGWFGPAAVMGQAGLVL